MQDSFDRAYSGTSGSGGISRLNVLNLLAYIVNVVITYGIGVAGFFGLPNNADLSAKYQTLVTPIGWAFSIWAVIFISQLIWSVLQLVGKFRQNRFVTKVGYGYVAVVAAQVGWTLAFSTEVIWLSLAFMVAIWVSLLWIMLSLSKVQANILEYMLWKFPFAIHTGWITAATAVNVNVLVVDLGSSTSLQYYVAIGSAVALLVVGFASIGLRLDFVIPAVISWALIGVYVELANPDETISANFTTTEIKQLRYLGVGIAVSLLISVVFQGVTSLYSNMMRARGGGGNRNNNINEESDYVRQDDA